MRDRDWAAEDGRLHPGFAHRITWDGGGEDGEFRATYDLARQARDAAVERAVLRGHRDVAGEVVCILRVPEVRPGAGVEALADHLDSLIAEDLFSTAAGYAHALIPSPTTDELMGPGLAFGRRVLLEMLLRE